MRLLDVDKARKLGLDEFVQANPSKFMHADLFRTLQKLTLDYRLNDIYTCLVSSASLYYCYLAFRRRRVCCKWVMVYVRRWCAEKLAMVLCRVGSVPARCSCWTSTVLAMEYAAVTDISATSPTYLTSPSRPRWSTRPSFTTASPSVPHTLTGIGQLEHFPYQFTVVPLGTAISVSRSLQY